MALTDNIVAYYKCDNVNDSVGSYNMTNNWTVTFDGWLIWNCANCGTSNTTKYLSSTHNLWFNNSRSISWRLYSQKTSGTQAFFWFGCSANNIQFQFYYSGWTLYAYRTKRGIASQWPAITYTLPQNTRTHFVITYNESTLKVFANGVYIGSASASWSWTTATNNWRWFAWYDLYWTNFIDWKMDEVWVWTRALTDWGISVWQTAGWEVAELYNSWSWLQYPFSTASAFIPKIIMF